MKKSNTLPQEVQALADRGALFVINNSGGKDSQAMLAFLRKLIPTEQILVIHAHLPGVEWQGTGEHARAISAGLQYVEVQAGKTFMEMTRNRGYWPSPKYRQCTSDLKRGPIDKAILAELNRRGLKLAVSCMGLRAEESCARAGGLDKKKYLVIQAQLVAAEVARIEATGKRVTKSALVLIKRAAKAKSLTLEAPTVLALNKRNCLAGREWYDWLPIHDWSKSDVILEVKKAGQQLHWAYEHVSRLSCAFCIMASHPDLVAAAKLNPKMYAEYVAMEKELDKTLIMPKKKQGRKFLEEVTGVKVSDNAAQAEVEAAELIEEEVS